MLEFLTNEDAGLENKMSEIMLVFLTYPGPLLGGVRSSDPVSFGGSDARDYVGLSDKSEPLVRAGRGAVPVNFRELDVRKYVEISYKPGCMRRLRCFSLNGCQKISWIF